MLIIFCVNETVCPVIFIDFYLEMFKPCARADQENTLVDSLRRAAKD